MRRPWIVLVLMALAVLGGVLIVTADESEPVPLDEITTAEGLITKIPSGWIVSEQSPFNFAPSADTGVFDQWTVARACPFEGCGERSLDEWLALAPDLPLFTGVSNSEAGLFFNLEVETLADARVLRAQTEAASRLVFVAAFNDGADEYIACVVRLGLGADERLAVEIVDVCRSTTRASTGVDPTD